MKKNIFFLIIPALALMVSCNDIKVKFGECKTFTRSSSADTTDPEYDCIRYSYDAATEVLKITHINTAFNCCITDVKIDISKDDSIISISESEKMANGPCDCSCLYDLDYSIESVKKGTYTIKVIEPYLSGNDEALEFEVDLGKLPEGTICKKRSMYPWVL